MATTSDSGIVEQFLVELLEYAARGEIHPDAREYLSKARIDTTKRTFNGEFELTLNEKQSFIVAIIQH